MNCTTKPEILNKTDAQILVTRIRNEMGSVRRLLVQLRDGQGWKAMGYSSMKELLTAEFSESYRHLKREMAAADVELNIFPEGPIGPLPESHARELSGLEPEQQREVYEQTKQEAEEEGGKVTAAALRSKVDEIFAKLPPERQRAIIEQEEQQEAKRSRPRQVGGVSLEERYKRVLASLARMKMIAEKTARNLEGFWPESDAVLEAFQPVLLALEATEQLLPSLNPGGV